MSAQLYDLRAGTWSEAAVRAFGVPGGLLPPLVNPGMVIGDLPAAMAGQVGLETCPVVAPCTHDTGSAVTAVPGQGGNWAFLSSGTWSVVGALTEQPVKSDAARSAGFCNELALGGGFLCRNIMGLWLVQQASAEWERMGQRLSDGKWWKQPAR